MVLVSFEEVTLVELSSMVNWAEAEGIEYNTVKSGGDLIYHTGVEFYIHDPEEQILFKLRFGYGKC